MEEDSEWRSEEEEGEEEKGLMAFPLIAPFPTFIPTFRPRIQPPRPTWPSRRGPCSLGGRAGTRFPPMAMGTGPRSPSAGGLRTHPGHATARAEHAGHPHVG